ncbi:hypothetical protein D3C75_1205900 [compost metagenome]
MLAVGHRHASGARHGGTHHFHHPVIHRDHRQTVHVQHAEEKLVILVLGEHVVGSDRNEALYGRIDQNGFIQIAAHRVDKFSNVGVFKTGARIGRHHGVGNQ